MPTILDFMTFVTNIGNAQIEAEVLKNALPNSDPSKPTFAEFLMKLMCFGADGWIKVSFIDPDGVECIRSAMYFYWNSPPSVFDDKLRNYIINNSSILKEIWRQASLFTRVNESHIPTTLIKDPAGNYKHVKLLYLLWMAKYLVDCGENNEFIAALPREVAEVQKLIDGDISVLTTSKVSTLSLRHG